MLRTLLLPALKDPRTVRQVMISAKSASEAQRALAPDLWVIHFELGVDEWVNETALTALLEAAIVDVYKQLEEWDKSAGLADSVQGAGLAKTPQDRARWLCQALLDAVLAATGERLVQIECPNNFLRLIHEPESKMAGE